MTKVIYPNLDCISLAELDLLTEHFALTEKERAKRFRPDERARIGRLYRRCRDFGYLPDHIDRHGRLVFMKPTSTPLHKRLNQVYATA